MSDFLTNLAARTIAQPSLRPRTRMRFEPAGSEEPQVPAAFQSVRSGDHREASTFSLPAVAKSEGVTDVPAAELRARHEPTDMPVSQAHDGEANELPSPPSIDAPVRQQALREPARETRVIETREVPTIETVIERVVEPPHRLDEKPPRVIREERVAAGQTHIQTEIRERTRERIIRARETQLTTSPSIRRSQAAEATAAAAAEPIIHVSIGRVEVRAVTTATPPARPPRQSTIMTIDDYAAKRRDRS